MDPLVRIQTEVAQRTQSILSQYPAWPCHKGCDHCCRHLAQIPYLTELEWRGVVEAMAALAPETRALVEHRLSKLAGQSSPYVCPFLSDEGACLIYESRPVACRTYGFFVERGVGLYCQLIETQVQQGSMPDIVWGNQQAVERQLDALGERRPLTEF